MAHYTLVARINAGDGKFPFVNVQFSKNHRPIPIERATYYLRPSSSGKRTPIKIGRDVAVAHSALVRMEDGQPLECVAALHAGPPSSIPTAAPRRRVAEAAREYIERSRQKSRRTYLGYRVAVNLFVASCKKTYFDEICRDDMLDFLHDLRTRPSRETGQPIGESTVFNYFLKTMVFLNDRGIGKYVVREDWVQKKNLARQRGQTEQKQEVCNVHGARGRGHDPDRGQCRGSSHPLSRWDRLPHWRTCGRGVEGHQLGRQDRLGSLQTEIRFQAQRL